MTTEMDTHACVYKDSEINKCNSFYMAKMGALPTMPLRCRTNQPDYKNAQQAQRGEGLWDSSLQPFPWSSQPHSSLQPKARHGRGEEEAQAEGEGEREAVGRHGARALQAVRRREGHPVRRPVHRQVIHGAAGVAAGAAAAARHPAVVPERVPEPAVPIHHHLHAHQLHHPGAPGVAHADARPGHQEVQGGALRIRVGEHEGGRGPALAGHDPARGRQQGAHPRAHGERDGTVQVQEGLPHHLRLRRAPAGRRRVHVRRRPQADTAGGGGAQGLLGPHRHARHTEPEEHHPAVPGRRDKLRSVNLCRGCKNPDRFSSAEQVCSACN